MRSVQPPWWKKKKTGIGQRKRERRIHWEAAEALRVTTGQGSGIRALSDKEVTTISDLCSWTLTLVYVGWCYGGYHGDAVHVETAALDRNCWRACAEIYIKDINFTVKGKGAGRYRWEPARATCHIVLWLSRTSFPRYCRACVLYVVAPLRRRRRHNALRKWNKGLRDVGKCKVTWRLTFCTR